MTAINNSECKARAKAVMNQTSPTIFIAALIGIGIPILIGWLTEGSAELMRGHRMDLFGLDLSFFGWIALETITRQVSGIYSGPYRYMAEAFFYERLQ